MAEEKKEKKSIGQEFKEFITRGNVVDMAVGVIIGGAFTAIVTALSDKILRPLINGAIGGIAKLCGVEGEDVFSTMYTVLIASYDANNKLDLSKSTYIDWGAFISAVINFLLIALVLFFVVKGINAIHDSSTKLAEKAKAKVKKEESEEEAK